MTHATPSPAASAASAISATSATAPVLTLRNPAGLYDPAPNGYSHIAIEEAGARTLHIAGQGGEDASGRLAEGFEAQVRQAFDNLRTALHAAGAAPRDVARLTVLIVDHSEERLRTLGAALREGWAGAPLPVCTLIPVPRLALDCMLFEVDATAVLRPA